MDYSRRIFLAFAAAGLARAQDAANSAATFSTDVQVISVLATVHEKGGKIVNDLAKEDFGLSEDGRPQTIKYFSRETDLPLTLGLLVDTSTSQRQVLNEEKSASYRFLERVLREDKDQAFLIHFDFDVELLQDVTNSRLKLEKALDTVGLADPGQPQMRRSGGGGGYPGGGGGYPPNGGGGGGRRGGGTALYDSILLASNEIMKTQKGRKALVLLTDGVDNGSKVPLSQAIEAAERADTLVYSIYFTGQEQQQPFGGFGGRGMSRRGGGMPMPRSQSQRPDGKKILQQISNQTGGGFFEVSKKENIDQIYARIQEELRNQYSLGYTSDNRDGGTGFRKINVTVKRKDLVVRTRDGYYPAQ
ncbi:MAG TPA: VWA domain-containing protein [Bryobacteraceae bacterium]|jgi:VWFA-related protein|nr:VWA domain-containing protein [Bryobacteraceae bacterium]